jgi:hypothetical protein
MASINYPDYRKVGRVKTVGLKFQIQTELDTLCPSRQRPVKATRYVGGFDFASN